MGTSEKGVRNFLFFPLISDLFSVTPIPGKQYPICSREQSKLCFEALKTCFVPQNNLLCRELGNPPKSAYRYAMF